MYLEGVTVCVNYSDFLRYTILFNKAVLDYYVVVTSEEDEKTQKLCEFYNIKCVINTNNGFNKGKLINEGLHHLEHRDWILHLDSDTVLLPLTKKILSDIELDKNYLYGVDRLMCPSYKEWLGFIENPIHLFTNYETYIIPEPWKIGARFSKKYYKDIHLGKRAGYIPLGYFQLWHSSNNKIYPEQYEAACDSDVYFSLKWERKCRQLLPELLVIHLESEQNHMGTNWLKRTTKEFSYLYKSNQVKKVNLDIRYE